jgi:ATP/maltotriose-dependent transcriptional regulator MalT
LRAAEPIRKAIRALLHVSDATMKTHLLRVFNKLGISAVTTAMSLGLLG